MAIQCLGNCVTCEALANNEVDIIICPLRIIMARTARIEDKINKLLEYNITAPQQLEVIEEQKTKKIKENEK
ncbi:MAG: hypothetical protein RR513_09395 [Muribaculaceae bacterium]